MVFDMDGSWGTKDAATNLAHELGHAFGLIHEHQKWSAHHPDTVNGRNYALVKFNCKNLKDYQPRVTPDEQCTIQGKASAAGFSAQDFLPYDSFSTNGQSTDFDWSSIMLYSSFAGAKNPNSKKIEDATLLDYNNVIIKPNMEPSKADAGAIKLLYPK